MKSLFIAALFFCAVATAYGQKPDLTITESTWRNKPSSTVITVANVGTAAATQTLGGYRCQGEPNEQGIAVGFSGQFIIPALSAGQKFKIFLNCGEKVRIKGVGVDDGNKIDESNENNNLLTFADVQIKTGPIKKP